MPTPEPYPHLPSSGPPYFPLLRVLGAVGMGVLNLRVVDVGHLFKIEAAGALFGVVA